MLKKVIEKLIWLYVLLLPLQTAFIFDERFINGAKWQYGSGIFYATEALLAIVAILSLILMVASSKINFNELFSKKERTKKLVVMCLWLFVGWSGLSIFWSTEKSAAFYLWIKLLEGIALFLIIVSLKINSHKLLWPLSLAAALEGLLAFWQFISQSINANKWLGIASHEAGRLGDIVIENSDGRWLRAYGSFAHPNILGGFCVFGLIAILELSRFCEKKYRLILIVLAMATTLGIFFSFSRSAWLAAIIAIIIFITNNFKEKALDSLKVVAATLLLLIAMAAIFPNLIISRGNLSNRLEQISVSERSAQAGESLDLLKLSSGLGVGINNYTAALHYLNQELPAYLLQPTHNIYLMILTELGILGLIIFLAIIILLLIENKNISTIIVWLLPLLTIGLFDHYLWTQYAGIMLFWLVLTRTNLSVKIVR